MTELFTNLIGRVLLLVLLLPVSYGVGVIALTTISLGKTRDGIFDEEETPPHVWKQNLLTWRRGQTRFVRSGLTTLLGAALLLAVWLTVSP